MRIIFAGTPEIGGPSLEILAKEFTVVAALTNPDRPAGRKRVLSPSPIKVSAGRLSIPVLDPERLNAFAREEVSALAPDILVSFAYSKIFGPKFLSLFPLGGINVHPSLLPRYRGPSPITAAILNRDEKTGISIQRTALKMDAGDIIGQIEIPLNGDETTATLSDRVAIDSAPLLTRVLHEISSNTAVDVAQNENNATYCLLVKKEHGIIDWAQHAEAIEAMVRAYSPWPRAITTYEGKQLSFIDASFTQDESVDVPGKVLGVDKSRGILIQTGHGQLAVTRLQLQAKNAMIWRDFINGNRSFIGTVLGG